MYPQFFLNTPVHFKKLRLSLYYFDNVAIDLLEFCNMKDCAIEFTEAVVLLQSIFLGLSNSLHHTQY